MKQKIEIGDLVRRIGFDFPPSPEDGQNDEIGLVLSFKIQEPLGIQAKIHWFRNSKLGGYFSLLPLWYIKKVYDE